MSTQEIDRRRAGVDVDPSLLSPPIVMPLYQCASAAVVVGGVAGAEIEVEVNAVSVATGIVATVLP